MSLLNAIRKLYGETVKQVDNSSQVLELLINGVVDNNITSTITEPLSNTVLDLSWNATNWNLTSSISQGENVIIEDRVDVIETSEAVWPTLEKLIDDANLSNVLTMDRLVSTVNETGEVYNVISEITNGYTTGVKQDVSALSVLIQSKTNISEIDKEKLISAVQGASADNKLSQYGWLSIVNNLFSGLKDHAENESTLMIVSGSPFKLQSVANIISTVLQTVVSGVLTALQYICTGILQILAALLNVITQTVKLWAPTDILINTDDSTDYIEGSNIVININNSYADIIFGIAQGYPDGKFFDSVHNGMMTISPGVDMYMWRQNSRNFIVNGRLCVNVDPYRLHRYINNRISYTLTHGGFEAELTVNTPLWPITFSNDNENFFLTNEESMQIHYDSDYADQCMFASIVALGLPYFVHTGKLQVKDILYNATNFSNVTMYDLMACIGYYGWEDSLNPGTWIPFKQSSKTGLYKALWNSFVTGLKDYDMWLMETSYEYTLTTSSDLGQYFSTNEQYNYLVPRDIICRLGHFDTSWNSTTQNFLVSIESPSNTQQCMVIDSIPSGWSFRPASFSIGQVVLAVTTIALLATAMFVSGKLVKKAWQNRSRIKQLNRVQQINAARDAYLANPTKTNAQELNYMVNRYNRIGRWLGWDSYDLTNNWYTARSDQTAVISAGMVKGMLDNETSTEFIARLITG